MKKIIIAASLLLIGTFQLQAKSQAENTSNDNAIIVTLNTASINTSSITGVIEKINTTESTITNNNTSNENSDAVQTHSNNEAPVLNYNQVFANRYTSLFWYQGRNVYA